MHVMQESSSPVDTLMVTIYLERLTLIMYLYSGAIFENHCDRTTPQWCQMCCPSPGTTSTMVVSIVCLLISLLWLFCVNLGSHGNVMPQVSFSVWESWKRSSTSAAPGPQCEWTGIKANCIIANIKQAAILESFLISLLLHLGLRLCWSSPYWKWDHVKLRAPVSNATARDANFMN